MSENNEHINSSAFKKYLSDKTSSAEKEAFEQSLEEGSFEEEALEGFKSLENDAIAIAAIQEVQQKMAKRTGTKAERSVAFPVWKVMSIAASFILFLGLGYLLTDLIKTDDNLALNEIESKENSLEDLGSKDLEEDIVDFESNVDSPKLKQSLEKELGNVNLDRDEMEPSPPLSITVKEDNMVVKEVVASKVEADRRVQNQDLYGEMEEFVDDRIVPSSASDFQELTTENKKERADKSVASSAPVNTESIATSESNSFFNIAKVNFNSKNYSTAIDYFQSSIDNRQNVQESTYYIGLSYFKLNKNVKAIKYFDDVIESESSWVNSAKWYKVLIYEERGDTASAIELLEQLANGNSAYKNQALDKLKAY